MAFKAANVIRIINAREVPASIAQGANYYFESDGQAIAETVDRDTTPPTYEYWYANGSRNDLITWNKQSTRDIRTSPSQVSSVFGRDGDVVANTSDYDANQIDFAPTGNLTATDSQTAIEQLLTEVDRTNAFTGKAFGNDLPNYLSETVVADNDSLETAISKLDAALNVVTNNSVVSFNGRAGIVAPAQGDYNAAQVTFTPTGTITAIDTQAAIAQLLTQLNTVDSVKANKITQIITPTGTSGLAGGGDLSADRTLVVDIPNTTALGAAPNVNDELLIYSIANAGLRAVKVSELLDSTTSGLSFSGTWNATTNTPALNDADGVDSGTYYKANTAGTINLGSGSLSFDIGDWVIYNGSAWEKVDQTDQVTSVFSRSGDVTAQLGDYAGSLIGLDTTGFNNILSPTEDTVQKAFDVLNNFSLNNLPLDTTNFNNILSPTENTTQKALDVLDNLVNQPATPAQDGYVTTVAQAFGGAKTFDSVTASNLTPNYMPVAGAGGLLNDSGVYWDGSKLGIGTSLPSGGVHLNGDKFTISDDNAPTIEFIETGVGTFYIVGDEGTISIRKGTISGTNIKYSVDTGGFTYFPQAYSDTVTSAKSLYIQADGKIGELSSSERYKKDIVPLDDVSYLNDIECVQFAYKDDDTNTVQNGVIAEQLDSIADLKQFVNYDEDGKPNAVAYEKLITPLVKYVQQLNQRIEALETYIGLGD